MDFEKWTNSLETKTEEVTWFFIAQLFLLAICK